jgi:hypothetical protein
MSQLEMFAPPPQRKPEMPNADSVRPRLEAVLRQLREGEAVKWSVAERRRWNVVFPQMCDWLPEEERRLKLEAFRALISEPERD